MVTLSARYALNGGPAEGPPTTLSASLRRRCDIEKKIMEDRYGFHEENHPLVRYLHSLPFLQQNQESQEIQLYLTRNWGEVNALALPDGTIIVSDRFFSVCEYQEELEFVLQHERTHVQEGHGLSRGSVGKNRLQEYRGDLEQMLKEEEHSLNPAGGILFLQRMAEREKEEKKSSYDLPHGDTFVRLINMEYAVRIVDLDALSADLNPIPPALRELPTPIVKTPWDFFEGHFTGYDTYTFIPASADEFLPAAHELSMVGLFNNLWKLPGPNTLAAETKKAVQDIFADRIKKEIAPSVSGNETVLKAVYAFLTSSLSSSAPVAPMGIIFTQRELLTAFLDGIQNLPASLPLLPREHTNINFLLRQLENNYPLEQACSHADQLVDVLKNFYLSFGYDKPWREADTGRSLLHLKRYPPTHEGLKQYLGWLEREKVAFYSGKIFQAVLEHYALSRPEQEALRQEKIFQPGKGEEGRVIITPGELERIESINRLLHRFYQQSEEEGVEEVEQLSREIFTFIDPASLQELSDFLKKARIVQMELPR